MHAAAVKRSLGWTLITWALLGIVVPTAPLGAQPSSPKPNDLPTTMRGFLGAEVNRDGLDAVRSQLGPAQTWDTGDAGTHTWWLCYRVRSGSAPAILVFSSDAEMGGSGREVDEIRLTRSARADTLGSRCAPPASADDASTPGGLRLGLERAAAIRLLGRPTSDRGDSVVYVWEHEEALSPSAPEYDYWNARRKECFDGRPPFIEIRAGAVIHFDTRGASDISLFRYDQAIC